MFSKQNQFEPIGLIRKIGAINGGQFRKILHVTVRCIPTAWDQAEPFNRSRFHHLYRIQTILQRKSKGSKSVNFCTPHVSSVLYARYTELYFKTVTGVGKQQLTLKLVFDLIKSSEWLLWPKQEKMIVPT